VKIGMAENTAKTKPKATVKVDLVKLYKELAKPLKEVYGEIAITRTKKEITRKGYDTTGYGYQFVANRFNEVLPKFGLDWSTQDETKVVREYMSKGGQKWFEVTSAVNIMLLTPERNVVCSRTCHGGHQSSSQGDAKKGAFTNAFKKTAALFGVGADAYEGTIDEDYQPIEPEATSPATIASEDLPKLTTEENAQIEKERTAIHNAETKAQLTAIETQVTALIGVVGGKQIGYLRRMIEAKAKTL